MSSQAGGSSKASRAPPQSRRFQSRAPGQSTAKSKAPGASRAPGASTLKGKQAGTESAAVVHVVRDPDTGIDVTPKSLLSAVAQPDLMKQIDASSEQSSALEASKVQGLSSTGSEGGDSLTGSKSGAEGEETIVGTDDAYAPKEAAAAPKAEEEPAPFVPLTEEELDAPVVVELRETDTFWLLEMPFDTTRAFTSMVVNGPRGDSADFTLTSAFATYPT